MCEKTITVDSEFSLIMVSEVTDNIKTMNTTGFNSRWPCILPALFYCGLVRVVIICLDEPRALPITWGSRIMSQLAGCQLSGSFICVTNLYENDECNEWPCIFGHPENSNSRTNLKKIPYDLMYENDKFPCLCMLSVKSCSVVQWPLNRL